MRNQKIMNIQNIATGSFLALFLILGSLSNTAQASVGRVLFKYGNVSVDSANARLLSRGARIDEGDVIITGPKGYVQLLLDDGTKIAVRPNSSFEIEALEMPATATTPAIGAGATLKASFKLQRGGFRTLTGRIARANPSAYRVTTPAAVIGVRGTNYSTRLCTADCVGDENGLYVGVSEGAVTMSNAGGDLDIPKNGFGFASDFNTPPQRLLAPPQSLQEESAIVLEEDSDDEEDDGDAEEGDSEEGDSEEGDSEEGDSEEGDSEEGSSEESSSEEGSDDSSDDSSGDDSSGDDSSGDDSSGGASEESSGDTGDGGDAGAAEGGGSEEMASEFGGGAPPVPAAPDAGSEAVTTTAAPEEPPQEIMAEGAGGETVDITDGQGVVVSQTGFAFSAGGVASAINTDFDALAFDADGNVTTFTDIDSDNTTVTFDIGTASNTNTGFDPTGSLKWGRWTAGVATLGTDTGSTDIDLESSSLHWLQAPISTNPDRVITGSSEYALVGNTDPTDGSGNRGFLGSASFFADFTNSVVESDIQLGIANEVWTASGQGDITSNLFNGLYNTVTVNGESGGSGSFGGVFSDSTTGVPGAAGLSYQLNDTSRTVSGVAVFNATTIGSNTGEPR